MRKSKFFFSKNISFALALALATTAYAQPAVPPVPAPAAVPVNTPAPVNSPSPAAKIGAATKSEAPPVIPAATPGEPVTVKLDEAAAIVFYSAFGPLSAKDRSLEFRKNFDALLAAHHTDKTLLTIKKDINHDQLLYDKQVLLIVSDDDAKTANKTRRAIIREYQELIAAHMETIRQKDDKENLLKGLIYSSIATVLLVIFWWGTGRIWKKLVSRVNTMRNSKIPAFKLQNLEVLSSDRATDILLWFLKWFRVLLILLALYFYFPVIFSFFPWTKGIADLLFTYVKSPISSVGLAIINYIPNIFFIAVIWVVIRYINKLVKLVFDEIKRGTMQFPGFHKDWADPTYKIVRFLVMAFGVVMVFPYLPGSNSPAFQGVSIFFGVLFSMGSTSAIANLVAGTVLTYMRPFQIGDRVKIADTIGDVIERNMLVTRIRTIKNVDITVANSMILSSHIINYSSSAAKEGLILHTTVTIGYDAPWPQVHKLLIAAALAVDEVLKDPPPFVLQKSLDDWYVSYELNAYTKSPNKMAAIYSRIHQKIQDNFNEAGVEIMSPHFMGLRDGNAVNIPADYLAATYQAPRFNMNVEGKGIRKK
ncbi:MAG: mechanosensitive ion channel family protein [Turneriella sp.]|nr:mechanosensitive ion channel family protein [Turneriella sp.]